MKKSALFIAGVFACASLLVTAQDVRYNFDKSADFSKYKTYKSHDLKIEQ